MTQAIDQEPDGGAAPVLRAVDAQPAFAPLPSWPRKLAGVLLVSDLAVAALASSFALLLRFGHDSPASYRLLTVLFPLGFVAAVALCRGYEARYLGAGPDEYRRVMDAGLRYLAVIATAAYAFRYDLARGFVVVALPLATVLSLVGRHIGRTALHQARLRGLCAHRVLVVGRERSAAELIRQLRREAHTGFDVVGAWIAGSEARDVEGVSVVSAHGVSVADAVRRLQVDTVAVGAWSPLTQDDLRRLCWDLEGSGVAVVVAPSLTDVAGPRLHIRPVAGLPLLHVEEPEFRGARRLVKGLFDRTFALLVLVLLCLPLLAVALVVRATSRGPALFRQVRVGRHGSTFRICKFRSMRVTAEQERGDLLAHNEADDGVLFKIRVDPRVTSLGEWLRRYSIDELPQLLNVLRGQMSLVGPRPPLPDEVARYATDVHRRLLVKPGLTGLWQVSGRSDLSWEESVRLDLHYVENWSLALDLAIIARTVVVVLRGSGAY